MCGRSRVTVPVRDAVGMVPGHDVTEINPKTGFKGSLRRGHMITGDDILRLQDLGKEHIYVLDISDDQMHEDDAALALAEALAGANISYLPEPREGKINLIASVAGLLKINVKALECFNSVGEVMCATRHSNTVVEAGDIVAGTRAIPLVVEKSRVDAAIRAAREAEGLVSVLPLMKASVGLIITGTEVYTGRIADVFEPVIREKVETLGSSVTYATKCPDNLTAIKQAVLKARAGADMIIMTGGMSVDPDDLTPLAAREAGAEITAYGSAVLPGAMFMAGYFSDGKPVLGVPACGIHHPRTILDLILPRVLAGEKITSRDIASLGHGGLCLDCEECRFPVCPFGKSG